MGSVEDDRFRVEPFHNALEEARRARLDLEGFEADRPDLPPIDPLTEDELDAAPAAGPTARDDADLERSAGREEAARRPRVEDDVRDEERPSAEGEADLALREAVRASDLQLAVRSPSRARSAISGSSRSVGRT